MHNVFIPEENVLRAVGRGLTIAIETLTDGRIRIGAQMLGLARGAFSTKGNILEKLFRDAKIGKIYEVTSNI